MSRRQRCRSAAYRLRRTMRKTARAIEPSLAALERIVESETLRRIPPIDGPFEPGKTYIWPRQP
jgi:hypothetical protein